MDIEKLVEQIKHNIDRSVNYEKLYNELLPSYKMWAMRYYESCSLDSIIAFSLVSLTDAVRKYDPKEGKGFVQMAEKYFVSNMDKKIREINNQWRREMRVRKLIEQYETLSGYRNTGLSFFEENWCSSVEFIAQEHDNIVGSVGKVLNEIELTEPEPKEVTTKEWVEFKKKRLEFFQKYGI